MADKIARSPLHALTGVTVIVGGCAAAPGVQPLGPDTYLISVFANEISGDESDAHTKVLGEANQYCARLGRQILVTNNFDLVPSMQQDSREGRTVVVTFRCLPRTSASPTAH